MSREAPENLRIIQTEAKRLADMVTKLMEYSYGRTSELNLDRIYVSELLQNVRAVAAPMCMKNDNQVNIIDAPCVDIHGNFEMLLQIFINLIANASKTLKTVPLSSVPPTASGNALSCSGWRTPAVASRRKYCPIFLSRGSAPEAAVAWACPSAWTQ